MEEGGLIELEPPVEKRPKGTLAYHVRVTFPRKTAEKEAK